MKHPYLISAPSNLVFANKHTFSKKHPSWLSDRTMRVHIHWDQLCMVHLPFIFSFNASDYKNSGLHLNLLTIMSTQEHSSFKQMILSQNFVMIAQLIILVRKYPGKISPYSSFFWPFSKKHKSFVSHILQSLKKEIGTLPQGTKVNKCPRHKIKSLWYVCYSPCYTLSQQF